MIVDAHVHFWDPLRHPDILAFMHFADLRRSFLPDDLKPLLALQGIAEAIVVQSEPSTAHSEFCADVAANRTEIVASIGWLDTAAPPHETQWKTFAVSHRGFRLMLNRMPRTAAESPMLEQICVSAGRVGLAIDLLAGPGHLPIVTRLAEAAPDTRFVLNHSAQPDTSCPPDESWRKAMHALGRRGNLFSKVSGLIEKSGGKSEHVDTHLACLFDAYPSRQLMFASNWPIVERFSGYGAWLDILGGFLDRTGLGSAARNDLFRESASLAYLGKPQDREDKKVGGHGRWW